MEYCSAIKRNIFDSVVLSLMNIDEPIIYCEVSQKSSGVDGIPVELFPILKDDAVKVLQATCQQI